MVDEGIFEFTKKATSYKEGWNKWQATWKNKGKTGESIELRKTFDNKSVSVLLIVALDGWIYKNKAENPTGQASSAWYHINTKGLNVRFSLNGPLMGNWDLFNEINQVLTEARELLEIEDPEQREAWILLRYLGN